MKANIFLICAVLILDISGCGLFKNSREEEIKERLQKYQEEVDRIADSLRMERRKEFNDSTKKDVSKELDSLKRISDSLEKDIQKNIDLLKKKTN